MRRTALTLAVATLLLLSAGGRDALAARETGWNIAEFNIRIDLQADGGLELTETITADFRAAKHGIYRKIPIHYDVALHQYSLRFRLLEVTDGAGKKRQTKVSYKSNYVNIRIGDPDRKVSGRQVYRIRYRVQRAMLWEEDHAILRWNATGNEWGVPILQSQVTVAFPIPLSDDEVTYDAWTGRWGSRAKDFVKSRLDQSTVRFTTGQLNATEGITVEIHMPPDAVTRPRLTQRIAWWLSDNFVYGLVVLAILLCGLMWWVRGRDAPGRGSIAVRYEPPEGMTPTEVGTLVDEKLDVRDISAGIIDLAVRGYLEIREVKQKGLIFEDTDYLFTKKKGPDGLRDHEITIFTNLFSSGDTILLSELKHSFYTTVEALKNSLYSRLSSAGYFDGNPEKVRSMFFSTGFVLVALAGAGAAGLQIWLIGRVFWFPLIASGVLAWAVVWLTSRIMPRKTRKGRIAWEEIAGLEEYVRRAEAEQIEQAERKGIFERLLPYAIVFGLADRWAKSFEGIYSSPPEWFRTSDASILSTWLLVSAISHSVGAMNTTLPSAPRSSGGGGWSSGGFSGGGFSGGGFGGGGGGSW